MASTYAWIGDGAPRMEVAHVERHGRQLTASGVQLGAVYELRYRLEAQTLSLDLVGERQRLRFEPVAQLIDRSLTPEP